MQQFLGETPIVVCFLVVSWLFFRFGFCFRKPSSVSLILLILPPPKTPQRGGTTKRHLCQASLHFMRNHRVQSAQIHALSPLERIFPGKEGRKEVAEIPMNQWVAYIYIYNLLINGGQKFCPWIFSPKVLLVRCLAWHQRPCFFR